MCSLMLGGCEWLGPKLREKLPLEPIELEKEPQVVYQELSNDPAETVDGNQNKVELYPGTDQFITSNRRIGVKPKSTQGEYSLNFDDADLGEVSKVILSDILGENYVLSPKVAGKVTLQTTLPLSKEELLPTLEMLLQINNAALVYQGGLYQIKPANEAVSSSIFGGTKRAGSGLAGYQVRVVPIRYVAVNELMDVVKPLLLEKTILHADPQRNLMMLSGTEAELTRALEIIRTFDVDVMKGRSFGLFPLQSVEPAKLIEELDKLFNKTSKDGEGIVQFMEIERLNAILAITYQASNLKEVERWVLRLDRANTSAGGGVTVYRAQHVDAVELAETLNEIFTSSSSKNKSASVAAGKKAVQVTNKKADKGGGNDDKPSSVSNINASVSDVGDVKIIADEVNNAVIVVATAQDYAVVQRVIKQLDVMPLQVLVDATIVEVSLIDNLSYGIKWFLRHENSGNHALGSDGVSLTDSDSNSLSATSLAINAATGGFGYAFVSNSADVRAVLDASASDNNLNVISSPSLMVLNNQEAYIQVGDEVPIRTSESTNTSSSTDPIQTSSIQQRKTGVKLKIKPRVNASGLVIMEIEQSVENVKETTVSGIDSPTIATREITSSVAINSGETIVLGGLIENRDTFNKGGIPLLHELPLIGPLFGNTLKSNIKTELVVLITPRVVSTRQDARVITNEFKRKLSGIYEAPEDKESSASEESDEETNP